jgi:hypothetical protein
MTFNEVKSILSYRVIVLCLLLFVAQESFTQLPDSVDIPVDFQSWTDYNYNAPLSKKFSLVGDIGIRGLISSYDFNQVFVRPGVRWKFHKLFSLAGSLAVFNTFNKYEYNLTEFRITADLNAKWPDLNFLNISYRLRIENRTFFFKNFDNENNFRGRLLVSFNTKRFRIFSEKRAIYFQAQFEPFYTFGFNSLSELFINQTRIHAIFGHHISDRFGYDIQYIWQQSRLSAEYNLQTTQNIFRLRIYHKLGNPK